MIKKTPKPRTQPPPKLWYAGNMENEKETTATRRMIVEVEDSGHSPTFTWPAPPKSRYSRMQIRCNAKTEVTLELQEPAGEVLHKQTLPSSFELLGLTGTPSSGYKVEQISRHKSFVEAVAKWKELYGAHVWWDESGMTEKCLDFLKSRGF